MDRTDGHLAPWDAVAGPNTTLTDGRRVRADECLSLDAALYGPDDVPELTRGGPGLEHFWFIACRCCDWRREHTWRPVDSFNGAAGPDDGVYGCEPCGGAGCFKVVTP